MVLLSNVTIGPASGTTALASATGLRSNGVIVQFAGRLAAGPVAPIPRQQLVCQARVGPSVAIGLGGFGGGGGDGQSVTLNASGDISVSGDRQFRPSRAVCRGLRRGWRHQYFELPDHSQALRCKFKTVHVAWPGGIWGAMAAVPLDATLIFGGNVSAIPLVDPDAVTPVANVEGTARGIVVSIDRRRRRHWRDQRFGRRQSPADRQNQNSSSSSKSYGIMIGVGGFGGGGGDAGNVDVDIVAAADGNRSTITSYGVGQNGLLAQIGRRPLVVQAV